MRQTAKRLGLLLGALAAGGLLAEIAIRTAGLTPLVVNPEQVDFWAYDPVLGWKHRPGQVGVFEEPQFRTTVHINSNGLRGREWAYGRTAGVPRIVVLGDSFAWGFGVEEAERFSEVLAGLLSSAEVINAGVSGYSTDQELLWWEHEGFKYQPDLVVLTFCGNDEEMNGLRQVYGVYCKPRFALRNGSLELETPTVPRAGVGRRFSYWLRRHSAVLRRLLEAWDALEDRCGFGLAASASPAPGDTLGQAAPPYALTRALIRRLQHDVEAAGSDFMIIATGRGWNKQRGSYHSFLDCLGSDGYTVVSVESLPGFDAQTMTIPRDGHWNRLGHRFVAEWLRRFIEQQNLLDDRATVGARRAR